MSHAEPEDKRPQGAAPAPIRLLAFALGLVICGFGCHRTPPIDAHRRHVLLITVDTLRDDYVGANGYPQPTTPFVDSLFAQGFNFTHALTTVPRTTPALASLLTGSYPHTHGVRRLLDRMAPEVTSLAELLHVRGYATIAVISNHLLGRRRGLNRGFDVYDSAGDVRDAMATTDAVLRHVRERTADEALFLWVHYIDPHVPYYPPTRLAREFDPGYRGRYSLHFGSVRGGIGDRAYPEDLPKHKAVFQNDLPDAVNAHVRKLYAADVRHTDDGIRRLVVGLRQRLGDDWLIVFTADHGESLGEHDFFFDHGDYVYNAELRVPLGFVFADGDPFRRATVIGDWVSLIDVMPTLAEVLQVSIPPRARSQVEGRSLVPYFEGRALSARPLFAECGHSYFPKLVRRRVRFDISGRFRAVVQSDWKLIWTPGQSGELEFELYNVADDPGETKNLYRADHPQVAALRASLRGWLKDTAAPEPTLGDAEREQLRNLGYLE